MTSMEASIAATRSEQPSPFLPLLENVVGLLDDQLDHPEIWAALAEASLHDDVADLRTLINSALPFQGGHVAKSLHVVAAMLEALCSDRATGLAGLDRIALSHPHCPQVAGAQFFVQRHGDPTRSADLSDRFCEAPFIKFETLMDGSVAPCCSIWTQKRLGHLDGQTADEIWNSPSAQAMRGSILDGSYRYCHKQRCTFITEDVLPKRDDVTDPVLRADIDENRTVMANGPRWLFLAHDVTCNLACPSCRDGILAADEAQERRFDRIQEQVFQPLLHSDGNKSISVSGQGDPWSSPHYRSILRYMADHHLDVELDLHTNALLMGEKRWAQYAGLDRYHALVNVSIDACTPWVYEVVRRPGRWQVLLPNLRFIADKRARNEFREFHLNATVQLDNFHEMPALVAFAQTLGADTMRLYMIQNTGGHVSGMYPRLNVAGRDHPLHAAFLETLRHPILGSEQAHLYDVSHWRDRAIEATLPSDRLGKEWTRADLVDAIGEAQDPATIAALCTAGRIRFPADVWLPLREAHALRDLGFPVQAAYRLKEREVLGGEAIVL